MNFRFCGKAIAVPFVIGSRNQTETAIQPHSGPYQSRKTDQPFQLGSRVPPTLVRTVLTYWPRACT